VSLPRVNVLLSSFNGAGFLRAQIDSVLQQQGVKVSIVIRDDGSTDPKTLEQLEQWQQHPQLEVYYGENRGATASFFKLLGLADDSAEYYAFCDQDDIWLADKLARGVNRLQQLDEDCALYCTRLTYVDAQLEPAGLSRAPRAAITPANALVENFGAGCTMVFTPALRRLAMRQSDPRLIVMHDWWLYLIAAFLGQVDYDMTPSILYRQHEANLVGGSSSVGGNARRRITWLRDSSRRSPNWWSQAAEFYDVFHPLLSPRNRQLLARIRAMRWGFSQRLALTRGDNIPYRQGMLDNLAFKLMLLCRLF
jgi:glycosyltransferase involved in cell wall biosynthesis